MNLYLITQDENYGYDTHDAAIVVAPTAAIARRIHPMGQECWGGTFTTWASSPKNVTAKLIGGAAKGLKSGSVMLASFNAG